MKIKLTILITLISLCCFAENSQMNQSANPQLYGVKIDSNATQLNCRTMPFLVAAPGNRGKTIRRKPQPLVEVIPINAKASMLYFLGMTDYGWDRGLHHWTAHSETIPFNKRNDQLYIGRKIGSLIIAYEDGTKDEIPLEIGATAWFFNQYAGGPLIQYKEPFVSSPKHSDALKKSLKLKESEKNDLKNMLPYAHYFLSVKPQNKKISYVAIHDDPTILGSPLVSAITIAGVSRNPPLKVSDPALCNNGYAGHAGMADKPGDVTKCEPELQPLIVSKINNSDLEPTIESNIGRVWSNDVANLAKLLYMHDSDLKEKVELIDLPKGMEAAKIKFIGDKKSKNIANILSSVWIANLIDMNGKFDPETGFFHESSKKIPDYGGYSGIGTWGHHGKYHAGAFPRCSDHYASLVLRCVKNKKRLTSYVDFCDKYLYYFRDNHDPEKGPPNPGLKIEMYPSDAPPHWSFVVNNPMIAGAKIINEIDGPEETDGHSSTMVGRWFAWRHLGAPTNDWLTNPRTNIYGKSRWDSTEDAAEFICWLLDYTGRDVVWCEGETTGWGAGGMLYTKGMSTETNMAKIKENYKKANMYEPYPSYVALTALRCSAQMADALDKPEKAEKWRKYADRIEKGMLKELTTNWNGKTVWRRSPNSVYPSFQDSMVQAWFSIYLAGLDPNKLHPEMTKITRNTLQRQLALPGKYAQPQAMGYGQGWLTKTALILDEMDDAGPLLVNLGKFSYDKNMNFVDKKNRKDWRKFMFIVPEGVNYLPDGSWYKIGDLGNGANQGIATHALELCAGIDDTNPKDLKIIPRVPAPLTGIIVSNFPVLIPTDYGLRVTDHGEISPLLSDIPSTPSGKGVDAKRPGDSPPLKGVADRSGDVTFTRAKIKYSYNKNPLSFKLTSDKILPTLSVRLGPFTRTEAEKIIKKIKTPKDAKKRIDKSGHYKKQDAYWICIEGMRNIKSFCVPGKLRDINNFDFKTNNQQLIL